MKDDSPCPLQYRLFNKRCVFPPLLTLSITRNSPTPPPPEEEPVDEDCWDMPTTEDFSLDVAALLPPHPQVTSHALEEGRQAFREKLLRQSQECVERERAEVEQGLRSLEARANGGSLLDMLSLQESELSQSPLPDRCVSRVSLTQRG